MKFQSVIWVGGKPYEAYQADHVASLRERIYMIGMFRNVLSHFGQLTFKQRAFIWRHVTLHILNPLSRPFYYRPVKEEQDA